MTVTPGLCESFDEERSKAIHDISTDTLKLALYDSSVTLAPDVTTAYAATNEVSGTGYSAGGEDMAISATYPKREGGKYSYRFDDVVWGPTASFTTVFGGLLYNSTKANRAIAILRFPSGLVVSSATLTISFPTTLPALLRF